MSIPKIIWAIWLNFDKKEDGKLDKRLKWYKERIINLHPTWEINIIDKWNDLLEYISEDLLLVSVIENNYIITASKSDAIRFFLLNKYGGFWLDFSTFLICPIDIYLQKQPNASFICYYTPSFMIEQVIFDSLGKMMDGVKWSRIIEKFKVRQKKYIRLNNKYSKYPYIPESFFVASKPNNYIIHDIYNEIMIFWKKTLPLVNNKEELTFFINKNMSKLTSEIFIMNSLDLNLSTQFNEENITNTEFKGSLLDNVWHGAYILIYLQMYKSFIKYIKLHRVNIHGENIGNLSLHSPHRTSLCFDDNRINSCQNIIVKNNCKSEVLYLLSLSYNRLIKWRDTEEERISFHNTYIETMLKKVTTGALSKDVLLDTLTNNGIYQIKFSHWTRNSHIIEMLMKIYTNKKTRKIGRKYKRLTLKLRAK